MKNANHTKGPWAVLDNRLIHAKGYRIAEMLGEIEHGKANAALIAAAPEMLEVLEFIADTWNFNEDDQHSNKLIQAAIRKAKGETV